MNNSLSQSALGVIAAYESLTFGKTTVTCPYFNNKRSRVRGALRVLIGKGTPKEIQQETMLMGLRQHVDVKKFSADDLKKFLVDNNLGIDCSGFVYHVLDAHVRATKKTLLRKTLRFPFAKNPLRKLLTLLRPVENTNVQSLAHDKNSNTVPVSDIQPGDMIAMVESKQVGNPDHIVLITDVVSDDTGSPTALQYVHALNWSTDGQYNHGVRRGQITITNVDADILAQEWTEDKKKNDNGNETYLRAADAQRTEIRRLYALT